MRIQPGVLILLASFSGATLSGDEQTQDEAVRDLEFYTGQMSGVIDRANEALRQLGSKNFPRPCATLSADWAIKDTALQLVPLRNHLSAAKIAGLPPVPAIHWPAWVFEPPACTSMGVLNQRSAWLSAQFSSLTDPVCEFASKKTGDSLICSVE